MLKIKKLFNKLFGTKSKVTIISTGGEFDGKFPGKVKYSNIKNSRIVVNGKVIIDNRDEK